ncbi:MAG: protein-disulfide reductase DsbD [Plesiomonas sp.]
MAQRLFTLILLLSLCSTANAINLFAPKSQGFVPVDSAFPFDFSQKGDQLSLNWQVKEGYYLYRHQFKVTAHNATLGEFTLPAGKAHRDEFFGEVQIFTQPLQLTLPILQADSNATLDVSYQGCASAGFCYPPETRSIPLQLVQAASAEIPPQAPRTAAPVSDVDTSTAFATPDQTTVSTSVEQPEQERLADQLATNRWTPLLFFILGIGMAFTPCVLPMFPLLSSVVLGGGQRHSHRRAFILAMAYVQGMALTYTLLGLVVAAAGLQFQAALQHPYVLIGLSILFGLLALSMFGLFSLQLPSSLQTRLTLLSGQQQGGNIPGVFLMGAIAGLICSPCTTAPLSGALLYVANSGDLLTGAVTLYLLAFGMGLPLIGIALFGNRLLPKNGAWMTHVKTGFGFLLLAMPIVLLSRLLPELWVARLWSILAVSGGGWLLFIIPAQRTVQILLKAAVLLAVIIGAKPLQEWVYAPLQTTASLASETSSVQAIPPTKPFILVDSLPALQQALAEAKGKPVMLDFYADWCVACKEFSKYTFSDRQVQQQFKNMVLLKADVTANNQADKQLLENLRVMGLPTLLFFDRNGNEIPQSRVTGFMPAAPFLSHLQNITSQ